MYPTYYDQTIAPKRITVIEGALDTGISLVNAIPCSDWRCKGARQDGWVKCPRCVALEHLRGIVRTSA